MPARENEEPVCLAQIERTEELIRRQEKGSGNQPESGGGGLFQRTGGRDRSSVPEADRSLSSRLRQEAQETHHEVDVEVATSWSKLYRPHRLKGRGLLLEKYARNIFNETGSLKNAWTVFHGS